MITKAQAAIKAAKNTSSWGRFAARRYAQKRGVSARLYRIARQCEAMAKVEKTFKGLSHKTDALPPAVRKRLCKAAVISDGYARPYVENPPSILCKAEILAGLKAETEAGS